MRASSVADSGSSSNESIVSNRDLMDLDDDETVDLTIIQDLGVERLEDFCKKASKSFFSEYGLISHQLSSYNDFIKNGLQRLLDSYGEISIEPGLDPSRMLGNDWRFATVKFGKVSVELPKVWVGDASERVNQGEIAMYPMHARLHHMTYASKMIVNVHFQVYKKQLVQSDKFKTGKEQYLDKTVIHEERKDVMIGKIPVMVRSDLCSLKEDPKGECAFDHGGYFIIKGTEKVFIAQEQICLKRLWISNEPNWSASYKSKIRREMVYVKLVDNLKYENIRGELVLTAYILSSIEIPVWLLFFALGVKSDKETVELIDFGGDDTRILNIIFASIRAADEAYEHSRTVQYGNFRKEGNALAYLEQELKNCSQPPKESLEECLTKNFFPNIIGLKQKARMLGYMVKCLLQAYTGHRKCENRSDFKNKRLHLAGELLEQELRSQLNVVRRRLSKAVQKDLYGDRNLHSIEYYFDASIISNGLTRAFSTGAWSNYYGRGRITGVVATLQRTNPLQTIAETRKMRQQVKYTGMVGDARYPHPSHWGRICYISTRDDENCGLVKNIAAMGLVSTNTCEPLLDALVDGGMGKMVDTPSTEMHGKYKIFLNGQWVGVCGNPDTFVAELRRKRRRKELPSQLEIKRDGWLEEVRIFSDAGRLLRPLLVLKNLNNITEIKTRKFSFSTLLDKGIIELLGVEEEEDFLTAWSIKHLLESKPEVGKYTHCELDMSFLLGLSCGIIPFANHDHAKRALFQSEKHSQQAIGFSTTNPDVRVDTNSHNLFYPQSPLFHTMISDCLGNSSGLPGHHNLSSRPEYFNGQVAIVAVNVHLGYNQEDSLVMNRASLERGMFRSEHFRSYKAEVFNTESAENKRMPKNANNFVKIQSTRGSIDSLDDDGFPSVGAYLQSGDIIIGQFAKNGDDHCVKLKFSEKGRVQKVVLSSNDEGKNFAAVSLRQIRSPCLGDKFSSMHGQKGVLGFLDSQENFPFTRQGIVPDIIINPHALPSRQTPGQLLEAALGKGIACGGSLKSATPFSALSADAIQDQLQRFGFCKWGNERVYNGRNGEIVQSLIFMGPTFYQRLAHMAEDKVKFRNTGPVHPLTCQPITDRKRFGGVKFGEMERDCLIAHGASANLHERLFTLSDSSHMHICRRCKNIANVIQRSVGSGRKVRGPYCKFCTSSDDIIRVDVPYGAKLLSLELFSMGITLKFDTRVP